VNPCPLLCGECPVYDRGTIGGDICRVTSERMRSDEDCDAELCGLVRGAVLQWEAAYASACENAALEALPGETEVDVVLWPGNMGSGDWHTPNQHRHEYNQFPARVILTSLSDARARGATPCPECLRKLGVKYQEANP